jgi:hypothetical protein
MHNELPRTVIHDKNYITLVTLLLSYHEIPVKYQIQKVQNLTIKVTQNYRSHIHVCCKAEDNEVQKSLRMTDYKATHVSLNY